MTRLAADDIATLDPYKFMAVIGKRVIHPGGRASTESLLARAGITSSSRVLDVGCGVATTAIEIARRHGAQVTAVDISPMMLERAEANVLAAGAGDHVTVAHGDILGLDFDQATFDVVIAKAVTMFVDRGRAAAELVRVAKPGGRVLATEFFWRSRPSGRRWPRRSSWARCAPGWSSTRWRTGSGSMKRPASAASRPRPVRSR